MSSSFRVQGQLSLDGSKFAAGLSRAEIAAARFGSNITHHIGSKLAGLFAIGALEEFSRKTIESADALVVAAKRMGVSVEQVQAFKQVAKDSNVELESIVKTFEKINIARAKALGGGAGGAKVMAAFNKAGITEEDLRNAKNTASALFAGQMASFAKGKSAEDLGAIFRDMGIKDVGPMIQVLQSDIEGAAEELRKMGGLMSTETAVTLKLFKDELELASQILVSQFAPALLWVVEKLYRGFGKTAGVSASLGAGTAKSSPVELIQAVAGNPLAIAKVVKDFSADEAGKAFKKSENDWLGPLNALKKKMEEEAEKLRHPTAPKFDTPQAVAKEKAVSLGRIDSDSIVGVGNFLGAGRSDSMRRIAEQQLDVQKQMLSKLGEIADNWDSNDSGFGGTE